VRTCRPQPPRLQQVTQCDDSTASETTAGQSMLVDAYRRRRWQTACGGSQFPPIAVTLDRRNGRQGHAAATKNHPPNAVAQAGATTNDVHKPRDAHTASAKSSTSSRDRVARTTCWRSMPRLRAARRVKPARVSQVVAAEVRNLRVTDCKRATGRDRRPDQRPSGRNQRGGSRRFQRHPRHRARAQKIFPPPSQPAGEQQNATTGEIARMPTRAAGARRESTRTSTSVSDLRRGYRAEYRTEIVQGRGRESPPRQTRPARRRGLSRKRVAAD